MKSPQKSGTSPRANGRCGNASSAVSELRAVPVAVGALRQQPVRLPTTSAPCCISRGKRVKGYGQCISAAAFHDISDPVQDCLQ